MIIKLIPQYRDENDQPAITVTGDTITINGTPFDFSQLAEGSTLPGEAIDSEWIIGDVNRTDGQIVLSLLLPHGARAPESTRFPVPITVTVDGPVELPIYDEPIPKQPPDAWFQFTTSDLQATFTAEAYTDERATITGYSWTFGDTNTSFEQNPVHTYAAAGEYTVTLTVTDSDGDTANWTQTVTVTEPEPIEEEPLP